MIHCVIENSRIRLEGLLAAAAAVDFGVILLKDPGINCLSKMISCNMNTAILLLMECLLASVEGTLDLRLLLGMFKFNMRIKSILLEEFLVAS